MRIKEIKFNHFRNLNLTFKPDSGFNIIHGENAKGKSNFLDGINLISTGKSFKGYKNQENLDFDKNEDFAKVEILVEAEETSRLATVFTKIDENKYKHSFLINEKPTLRSKFTYKLKTILFTPVSLEMILGSPDIRRDQIDDLLSTFDKDYEKLIKEYSYVMRSRNKLLVKINKGGASREQLSYWTDRLVKTGTQVRLIRINFLKEIRPNLTNTASKILPKLKGEEFKLKYLSDLSVNEKDAEEDYYDKLREKFPKEVLLGRTLYGPHRDDLEFSISDRNLHTYGSRGEQRLATMVFKISAFDYLSELYKTKIVFLLDDIFSELDAENKKYLLNYVKSKDAQVFLTTANKSELPNGLLKEGKLLNL